MQVGSKVKVIQAGHAGADVKENEVLTIVKETTTEIHCKKKADDKEEAPIRFRKSRLGVGYEAVGAPAAKSEAKPAAKTETKTDEKK